jgi:hypothetical protein
MLQWLAKKGENARVSMCIKEVKWELETADATKRAMILAVAQHFRVKFTEADNFLAGIIDRPLDFSRSDVMRWYDAFEAIRNNNALQFDATRKNMRRLVGMELPQLMVDHAKMVDRGVEVWMCTLGAGVAPDRRDEVRAIWSYLAGAFDNLPQALARLKAVAEQFATVTGADTSNMFDLDLDDVDAWRSFCRYTPAVFANAPFTRQGQTFLHEGSPEADEDSLRTSTAAKVLSDPVVSKDPVATSRVADAAQIPIGLEPAFREGPLSTERAQDDAEAVKWCRKAAERGDASAQFNLALMYYNGQGVTQDYAEALKWCRKAAEQDDASAQTKLGVMYSAGPGVTQDRAEAVRWFRKAAEQDDANGQNRLGIMYGMGWGVAQDDAEAVRWFRKSAEQGDAEAQNNLGFMYREGDGVTQDYAEAVRWFRKAAEQDDASAQNHLGIMYRDGHGVTQDDAQAHMWFSLSAAQGDKDGAKGRDMVARKMTPAQIAEAQKLAREWKPKK